jgi:hypothetical protein
MLLLNSFDLTYPHLLLKNCTVCLYDPFQAAFTHIVLAFPQDFSDGWRSSSSGESHTLEPRAT